MFHHSVYGHIVIIQNMKWGVTHAYMFNLNNSKIDWQILVHLQSYWNYQWKLNWRSTYKLLGDLRGERRHTPSLHPCARWPAFQKSISHQLQIAKSHLKSEVNEHDPRNLWVHKAGERSSRYLDVSTGSTTKRDRKCDETGSSDYYVPPRKNKTKHVFQLTRTKTLLSRTCNICAILVNKYDYTKFRITFGSLLFGLSVKSK